MTDSRPTTRRHVIIYQEDYETIMALWGETPGFSFAVREILHKYIKNLNAKAMQNAGAKPITELDGLEDLE